MNHFLQETRTFLHRLTKDAKVHVVLGNEACDLDSAVAALVYAFYLYKENIHPGTIIIPLLNIHKHELWLRADIVALFKESNVHLDLLVFLDDIDLKKIQKNCQLTITLVDHNTLPKKDTELQSLVIEVIDHHHEETKYDLQRCHVTIEKVGSCCTLIAEKILSKNPKVLDYPLALLLYGTILVDTICLNEIAKRVTAKDKNIASELEKLLGNIDRNTLFQKLHKAKFNITNLTMEELLSRDVKIISNNTMNIVTSSLTALLEEVLKRPEAESELKKFSLKTNSQIVILLSVQIDDISQETTRQLAIYSELQGYREQLVDVLEAASLSGPTLQLQLLKSPFPSVTLYNQGNIVASRKVILPLLKTFLLGEDPVSNCEKDKINKGLAPESKSEDDDIGTFDPLASESEDVLDSLTNSVSHLHVLGIGDPISHAGSSQSSSNQNSCPYTPQNSCTDGGLEMDPYARQILPSFNSREMMEKIESKRGKLRGYDGECEGDNVSYPFTPKNSFVDNSFDSYVKSVPSFDSGDFLLKVNEKVSTMSMPDTVDGAGNISMEVPIIEYPQGSKPIENGQAHTSEVKEEEGYNQECKPEENGNVSNHATATEKCSSGNQNAEADDRGDFQSCPEGVSFSDKLEKSDEKMDISDTSGSSEKNSPLPNDTEVHTTTATMGIPTDPLQASDTNNFDGTATTETSKITNTATNAHPLIEKNRDTHSESATSNNLRTSSTASVASLSGEDVDLELPANYQTETVDFPDSPGQLKLMNQSTHELQGACLDDPLQEEDEDTEQPDDEVFRAVLSPSSEGAKLKKAFRRCLHTKPEMFRQSSSSSGSSALEDSHLFIQELESSSDHHGDISASSFEDLYKLATDRSHNGNYLDFDQPYRVSSFDYASTPYVVALRTRLESVDDSSCPHLEEAPSAISSTTSDTHTESVSSPGSSINVLAMEKINSYFDQVKIKDIHVMSNMLPDILTPNEIEDILQNSEAYEKHLSEEMLEALQLLQLDREYTLSKHSQSKQDSEQKEGRKKRISLNRGALDGSILDHFDSELHISAVFEGNRSLRRPKKQPKTMPHFPSQDINSSKIKLMEVSCGSTEAYFEESMGETDPKGRRKKLFAPVSLGLPNITGSPEMKSGVTDAVQIPDQLNSRMDIGDSEMDESGTSDVVDPAARPDSVHNLSEFSSPERPSTLSTSGKKKRKIKVNPDILNVQEENDDKSLSSLSNQSDEDIMSPIDDIATPDDIETPDDLDDSTYSPSEQIEEVSAAEERDDERRWRTCVISGLQRKIDMKVIEPYKKVLSHGGYYGPKRSAIIVFCACYLPDHSRKDYDYVMDNLFLYVLTTLDQLVAEDYILVYLHGAMDRNNMPTFGWLKRCYQMIDRRLRKNLKGLYLVHPTFWLKTIVIMTRPFISSKFSRKLQFVNSLKELEELVPIDEMSIPDRVKQLEFELMIKEKKRKNLTAHK